MSINITGSAKVTADCGHKVDVPIGRLEGDHECPVCGKHFSVPQDQLDSIKAQLHKATVEFALQETRKAADQMLRGVASRSKRVTYRPGGPKR